MEVPFIDLRYKSTSNNITINNNANANTNQQPQVKCNNNNINYKNYASTTYIENTNDMLLTNAALSSSSNSNDNNKLLFNVIKVNQLVCLTCPFSAIKMD